MKLLLLILPLALTESVIKPLKFRRKFMALNSYCGC